MMLPLLAPLLSVPFTPDFVTVEGIANRFREQGIEVRAAEDCRDDVYVLASDGLTVEALGAALSADGRLELAPSGKGTIIRRASMATDRAAYLRYDGALRDAIAPIYARVVSETLAIRRAEPEQREKYLNIYNTVRDADPVMAASNHMIRLINVDNDVQLSEVTLPLALIGAGAPPLGRTTTFLGMEAARLLEGGDLARAMGYLRMADPNSPPEVLERQSMNLRIDLRLKWDPFSAHMSAAAALSDQLPKGGRAMMNIALVPKWVRPVLAMNRVLTFEEQGAYARRVAGSAGALAPLGRDDAVAAGRLSESLLSWSRAKKGGVLAYVSSLTDLHASGSGGVAGALAQVNRPEYKDSGAKEYVRSIVGNDWSQEREACLKGPAKFTAALAGGMLVVRNEMAFLDTGAPAAGVPSPDFLRARAAKQPVTLEQAVRSAAQMRFGPEFSGAYAVQWTDVGSPLAFRPFALALLDAPKLMQKVSEMTSGSLKVPATELPTGAVVQGMRDVLPYGKFPSAYPTLEAPNAFTQGRAKAEFVVQRTGEGGIEFRIGPAEFPIWKCELSHLKLGKRPG
ncbi:hypothetical protein EON79_05390 [bacterium]|nr:MAG: hypothetical protein EON79_05390 [bacterium]